MQIDAGGATPLNTVVAGNYIGLDVTGSKTLGAATTGVGIFGPNNLIGTNGDGVNDAAERNTISGSQFGIRGWGNETIIAGNYIGTDASGTAALGQAGGWGILWDGNDSRIGTDGDGASDTGERNVISGNAYGIGLRGPGNLVAGNYIGPNVVAGNYVGTDKTGSLALGNAAGGIGLFGGAERDGYVRSVVLVLTRREGIESHRAARREWQASGQ